MRGEGQEVAPRPAPARPFHQPPYFVGREAALAQLTQCYTMACQGTRQCVVLTGEAGIGKTALVQAWLAQVAATGGVWIAQGQCLDHYGAGEAYLPVLEALDRLGRTSAGEALLAVLDQQAPMWLAQLPALLSPVALEAVQRRVVGATRERMLREMANALDMFTQAHPLVLILEDLHWSDAATLDLLAAWARRPDPARLLVLGTYRPVDVMVRAHALKALTQDLEIHGQCTELPLELLSADDVARYLAARFAAEGPLAVPFEALARTLYQRTEGHPLFLTAMVDDLVREGVVQAVGTAWAIAAEDANTLGGIPASLRRMIVQQYEELSPQDQQVVEAASVAGMAWSAAAVAAGLGVAVEVVEASCAALARRGQLLTVSGLEHWPDGTVAESYRWRHTLYQEVCYDRVPAGRRVRLHRRIGARLEAGYGAQACVRAAVLADHFVRGHDAPQAVPYLQQAAQNACQRHGYQEAIGHLTRGLALLATLPETLARAQQELALHMALGPAVMAIKGTAHPEVEQIYARARALCQHVGAPPHLFETLWGLCRFYRSQAALQTARELGEQLAWLAERTADPMQRLEAHDALGTTLFYLGDYAAAWTHVEKGIALTDPTTHHAQALRQGEASGLRCLGVAAQALWCLGYPAQRCSGVRKHWRWPRNWRIPIVSRRPTIGRPPCRTDAVRAWWCRHRPTPSWPWRPRSSFPSGQGMGPAGAAGYGPGRALARRAWRRGARGWPPSWRQGSGCLGPSISSCSLRPPRTLATWRRGCACSPRPSQRWQPPDRAICVRRRIGSRVSYGSARPSPMQSRPKRASRRPWWLRAASKPSPGSCVPLRA